MFVVAGDRDAPFKGGAADREVFEAAFDEAFYFVEACFGLDEAWVFVVKFQQAIGEFREFEEIAWLFDPFDFPCRLFLNLWPKRERHFRRVAVF